MPDNGVRAQFRRRPRRAAAYRAVTRSKARNGAVRSSRRTFRGHQFGHCRNSGDDVREAVLDRAPAVRVSIGPMQGPDVSERVLSGPKRSSGPCLPEGRFQAITAILTVVLVGGSSGSLQPFECRPLLATSTLMSAFPRCRRGAHTHPQREAAVAIDINGRAMQEDRSARPGRRGCLRIPPRFSFSLRTGRSQGDRNH